MTARARIRLAVQAAAVGLVAGTVFAACAPGALAADAGIQAIPTFTSLPTVTLSLPPNFSIDQTQLDFGDVPVGSFKRIYVTLTNHGSDATDFSVEFGKPNAADFSFTPDTDCMVKIFTMGRRCFLIYQFAPTSLGFVTASSKFEIDYLGMQFAPQFDVALIGCGVGPNGARCPNRPTPSPTPSPTRLMNNGGGSQPGPEAQPTGGGVAPVGGPLQSDTPASTPQIVPVAATDIRLGSVFAIVLLTSAVTAVFVAVITGLLVWRGRRIWEFLTSRRS